MIVFSGESWDAIVVITIHCLAFMFLLSFNTYGVPLLKIDYASGNNYFGVADNLVFRGLFFKVRNMLEFLTLVSAEHLIFYLVRHTLLAATAIFRVHILLFLDFLLLLEFLRNNCLKVFHVSVILLSDFTLFRIGLLFIHINLLFELVKLLHKIV